MSRFIGKTDKREPKNRAFNPQNRRGKRACIIDTGVSRRRSLITTLQIALGYSIFCRLIIQDLCGPDKSKLYIKTNFITGQAVFPILT